jgi:hypothetical protein
VFLRLPALALALTGVLATTASAAPPGNDSPASPADFTTFDAPNGTPREQVATAELAEATADPGVPACLGDGSFARTVWFRVAPTDAVREITVEATGRTTALVDLAAFVQPGNGSNTSEPNACSGEGAGGSEASEEPASAVSLRVPAGRTVLIQVGRRGAPGSAEDERAQLSLASRAAPDTPRPAGDEAATAPVADGAPFAIGGATTTEEDPAAPACPALGSVWRRLPGGASDIAVFGDAVATLTVFAGERPTGDNAVACVNRERPGALRVRVDTTEPVWVRIGTDRAPADATATLAAGAPGRPGTIPVSTGGGAPTPGAGRASSLCVPRVQGRTARTRTRVALALAGRRQLARQRNRFKTFPVTVQVFRGPLCRARVELVGPRGRVYARGTLSRLAGRRAVRLQRVRRVTRGAYRLRITALSRSNQRFRVSTSSKPRLRIR